MTNPIYEECGVFGVWSPQQDAVATTLFGLIALQHRGQESAGICWTQHQALLHKRGMGLVGDIFSDFDEEAITSPAAIGHVRYSAGDSGQADTQPLLFRGRLGHLALAHNGSLVNARDIRRQLEQQGSIFQTASDCEVVAHLLARATTSDLDSALVSALGQVRGAYAFVILTPQRLLAIRDPHGIRPLVLGKLPQGGWVVASETCALDTVGAEFFREVEPGEMVSISANGVESTPLFPSRRNAFCSFEFVYFARPDSDFAGRNVHMVRREMGRELAREAPAEADIVTGVPDSSLSAAAGYAEAAGLPYETGLIRNRYLGRTFIRPNRKQRERGVSLKLNPISGVVTGQRVVLVDDSLVRGTTSRKIVSMLRREGAKEVHLRIASPPVRYSCNLGMESKDEPIAAQLSTEEILAHTGADSLEYLSSEGLVSAIGLEAQQLCLGCFEGTHPVRREET